ncbi:hypothetical protein M0802_004341 [Mischocyttarus mexicanus]|nr:hypothetical protein M0802_004341 [Mischocyttarus mexicanus]
MEVFVHRKRFLWNWGRKVEGVRKEKGYIKNAKEYVGKKNCRIEVRVTAAAAAADVKANPAAALRMINGRINDDSSLFERPNINEQRYVGYGGGGSGRSGSVGGSGFGYGYAALDTMTKGNNNVEAIIDAVKRLIAQGFKQCYTVTKLYCVSSKCSGLVKPAVSNSSSTTSTVNQTTVNTLSMFLA